MTPREKPRFPAGTGLAGGKADYPDNARPAPPPAATPFAPSSNNMALFGRFRQSG